MTEQAKLNLGPVTDDMTNEEKVIRWATRYCCDPGAGPSPSEEAAIREVMATLESASRARSRAEVAEAHIFQIGQQRLRCPRCGGTDGTLGTSNAYWVCGGRCREETGFSEQYWTPDNLPVAGSWTDSVMASPWGRPAHLAEEIRKLRGQLKAANGLE